MHVTTLPIWLKAIKKELGENEDTPSEVTEYVDKIKKVNMPKEARTVAENKLDHLHRINPASAAEHEFFGLLY